MSTATLPRAEAPCNWPAAPKKYVKPKRETAQVEFARRLYGLLQRPSRGKPQEGASYGGNIRITGADFEDHLFGGVVLAVGCVNEDGANFLAFDCDEGFGERLPIYAAVLQRRGLAGAAFATTGTTPGRGKVIVTLARRLPQPFARALALEIQGEVVADPRFGDVRASALTAFPTAGDGSYCRVLGRKAPSRPFEVPITLGGKATDLRDVEPATIDAPSAPATRVVNGAARLTTGLSAWAQATLSQAFTGNEPDVLRTQLRLATEAVRIFGDEGENKFLEWMQTIAAHSPGISASVLRQLHRADAFPKAKARLERASSPQAPWQPYIPWSTYNVANEGENGPKIDGVNVASGARRVCESLAAYVVANSLNPRCFAMDYQRMADLSGYAKKPSAYRAVLQAEEAQLLCRLHPGTPRSKGSPGASALFCLRGEGETMDDAIEIGKCSKQYVARTVDAISNTPKPKENLPIGALTWEQLREADRVRYEAACEALDGSPYLPHAERGRARLRAV